MKRILAISLALLAAAALIFGAALIYNSQDKGKVIDGQYKLHMGTYAAPSAVDSEEAKSTVTTVAVITDGEGKIVDCVIDCGDYGLSFDDAKAGKNGTYQTKNELGDNYNMVAYGGSIAEWYKQAEHFADFVKGMDAKEATGLELAADGKGKDADLLSGCTIAVTDFKNALVKAMGDTLAVSFESDETPKLSLAMMNADTIGEAGEDGSVSVKMTTTLMAVATHDGKVLAAVTDVAEADLAYSAEGKVAKADYAGTKREKLDSYGMVAYAGAKYEWYEQADNFCKFIKGMSAKEVAKIKMDDAGKATDADLVAGCTITIGDFVKIASKALGAEIKEEKGGYTLGLGSVTAVDEASAKQTTTVVAVITDGNGKIVDCVVDCVESTMSLEGGKASVGGTYKTKTELGDDYGMVAYAGAKYEWYQQAENFCEYVKGLDLEGAKAIDLEKTGKAKDADLVAGCTIAISEFKEALVKALEDKGAVAFDSKKAPEISVAIITDDSASTDASADKAGSVSFMVNICAAAVADGKTQAAIIDVANPTFAFDVEGKITETAFPGTKREQGDSYGMVAYAGAKYEWYEQSANFCEFIKGMTADEIAAIQMTDVGKPADADLTAGCTIAIGDFIKIAEKALKA